MNKNILKYSRHYYSIREIEQKRGYDMLPTIKKQDTDKEPTEAISVTLVPSQIAKLDKLARALKISRSAALRVVLSNYFEYEK